MFRGAGSRTVGCISFIFSADFAGDCELRGIFSIFAKQVREQSAPCVDEPVTDLVKRGKISLELLKANRVNRTK